MEKTIIIRPKKTFSIHDFKEIWRYKELLYFFVWRDFKIRYKQTFIGVLWAIFQPFITMVVFTIFFGKLAKMPSDGIPYPIFVYTGLLLWQFFSASLSEISNSLVGNTAILTKIYFPRLILPISITLTNLLDFIICTAILVGMMAYYHYLPNLIGLLILPLLLLICIMATLGIGLFLASVNVKYRDVRYVLPFFLQMMLFITPVIYPSSIAGRYSWIFAVNPMTGVIEAARAAILTGNPVNWTLLAVSFCISLVLLIIGTVYFKKIERLFADIV